MLEALCFKQVGAEAGTLGISNSPDATLLHSAKVHSGRLSKKRRFKNRLRSLLAKKVGSAHN
jgi:hypothetical protein